MTKIALELNNLTKTYASGFTALKGINLVVEQGEFFALLGPNGAGKSTAIGIITSLVNKTEGQVHVFGHNLETERIAAKACIGLVPQEFNFNQFEKVIEIIINQAGFYGIGRAEALKRAEFYLKKLGLWDKKDVISRTLSGGMKRRLMIARALIHHPKILILDEPTAGVDIELRRTMWQFLQELNRDGTTIILTTHYLEEAEALCRGIAIIDQGKIVERTTIKELLSRLNTETLILDLKLPIEVMPNIKHCLVNQVDEQSIEVTFPKNININDIFAELALQKFEVSSLRNKSNRLEELFLQRVSHINGI